MKSQPRLGGNLSKAARQRLTSSSPIAMSRWVLFRTLLSKPVNGASLAVFRMSLGIVMALEAWSLLRPDPAAIGSGLSPLETYYTGKDITFHFPYELFGWLPLLTPPLIYALVIIQAIAGLTMAIGLCYRLSAAAVFLAWGYLWVVESTRTYWQSHYYLETLLAFLMIWMPAARRYSVDAWLARKARGDARPPELGGSALGPAETVPYWTLLLLRGQLLIAYFYAGVAKLNVDWLLDAMPVRWFIAQPHVTKPYESFLSLAQVEAFQRFLHTPEFAYFLSYAGLVFDLAVGFLLLIRRTRMFALVLLLLFHATNHFLIFDDIGWFPLVGILTPLIFLDPDWPERFWGRLRRSCVESGQASEQGTRVTRPSSAFGGTSYTSPQPQSVARSVAPFVIIWLLWQTVTPIRHLFIPGNGRFTYEGLTLSWRLKSEVRHALAAQFYPVDRNIISVSQGTAQINWQEWKEEKIIHRLMPSGAIDWQTLPEIMVLLEPIVGERIIYNPFPAGVATEPQARQRLALLWREMYGRDPGTVRGTMPLPKILDSIVAGSETEQEDKVRRLMEGRERASYAEVEFLRTMQPFALERRSNQGAPFLIVEDRALLKTAQGGPPRVRRDLWKHGDRTRSVRTTVLFPTIHLGADPLVIYLNNVGPLARDLLPQACVMDVQANTSQPPYLWWNGVSHLPLSKFLHVSQQAFYLRRYAWRIAALWQEQYGRRPAVQATTAVSLNGRPHQFLVDPGADLATVPVSCVSHNPWIRDLETPRIPRQALEKPPLL